MPSTETGGGNNAQRTGKNRWDCGGEGTTCHCEKDTRTVIPPFKIELGWACANSHHDWEALQAKRHVRQFRSSTWTYP